MHMLLDSVLAVIAPHECLACALEGGLLCQNCITLLPQPVPRCYRCASVSQGWDTCKTCKKQSPLSRVVCATTYEGYGEVLVRRLKFERAYAAHKPMARAMAVIAPENLVFVPVPTAPTRIRQRGYDQATLIARKLAKASGGSAIYALTRYGNQRQTGASRSERLHQLRDVFEVKRGKLRGATSVVLVDDVVTTGATLEAAAWALRDAGVRDIAAITFARAE